LQIFGRFGRFGQWPIGQIGQNFTWPRPIPNSDLAADFGRGHWPICQFGQPAKKSLGRGQFPTLT